MGLPLSFCLIFVQKTGPRKAFFVLFFQDKGRSARKICFKRFHFIVFRENTILRCNVGKHVSHPYDWVELVDAAAPDPDHV